MIDREYLDKIEQRYSGMMGPGRMLSTKTPMLDLALWGCLYYQKLCQDKFKPSFFEKMTARAWCQRFNFDHRELRATLRINFSMVQSLLFQSLLQHGLLLSNRNMFPVAVMRMSEEVKQERPVKVGMRCFKDVDYFYTPQEDAVIIKSMVSDDIVMYGDNPSRTYVNDPYGFMFTLIEDYGIFDDSNKLNKEFMLNAFNFLGLKQDLFAQRAIDYFLQYKPNQMAYNWTPEERAANTKVYHLQMRDILGLFYTERAVEVAFGMYESLGDTQVLKQMLTMNEATVESAALPEFV